MAIDILDELEWRGLIAQSTDRDALAEALAAGPITVYSGFDPTAPSLHAGHLVPLLTLRRLQQAGHRPIVLAGGATGFIGDPRDTGERTMNTADTVADWADRIRGQLERFVEFDDSPTGAIVENNLSWTGELSAIDFLRDVGKHFSVNVMLDRDTVRRRLEGDGISYTEFSYMLLQANDYVELHRRYGCTLQIGGSDQWGNIIAGVRLVRQKAGRHGPRADDAAGHRLRGQEVRQVDRRRKSLARSGDDQPVCLLPVLRQHRGRRCRQLPALVHLPDGRRAGRTRASDRGAAARARCPTPAGAGTHHLGARSGRDGCGGTRQSCAVRAGGAGRTGRADARGRAAGGVRRRTRSRAAPDAITDLLVASGLSASKGAARRTIAEGGVSVNNVRIESDEWVPQPADFLHGKWLVLRRGKRNIAGVERVG